MEGEIGRNWKEEEEEKLIRIYYLRKRNLFSVKGKMRGETIGSGEIRRFISLRQLSSHSTESI